MSNRANAQRYGGTAQVRVPRVNPTPGGYGTSGGLQLNPVTGQYEFTPRTVAHPTLDRLFNRGGAQSAAQQYNDMVTQMLLQQQLGEKNIHATGEENRLTAAKEGEEQRKTNLSDAQIATLKEHGIVPNDVNNQVLRLDKATTPYLISAANAIAQAKQAVSKKQMETVQSQPGQDIIGKSQLATLDMPRLSADNLQAQTDAHRVVPVPADTNVLFPPTMFGGQPGVATGPSISQGLIEGPPMNLGNGMSIPGKSFPSRQVTPGSVRIPAPLGILNAVPDDSILNGVNPGVVNPAPSDNGDILDPQHAAMMLQIMKQLGFTNLGQ